MPTLSFSNLGDVMSREILVGTIQTIDPETDTCTVTVNGSVVSALLFYHCRQDSVLRDNGAIQGAAAGFSESDQVVVIRSKSDDTAPVYVVGHVEGIRTCGQPIIIVKISSSRTKKIVLLWDYVSQKKADFGFDNPCDDADVGYLNWLAEQEDDPEAVDLFPTGQFWIQSENDLSVDWIEYGTEHRWDGPAGDHVLLDSIPSISPLCIGMTDTLESHQTMYQPYPGGGFYFVSNMLRSVYDINAYGFPVQYFSGDYEMYLNPERYPSTLTLNRDAEVFEWRVRKHDVYSSVNTPIYRDDYTLTFIGPWGEVCDISGYRNNNLDNAHRDGYGLIRPYFYGPMNSIRNTIVGRKSKKAVHDIFLMQYTLGGFSYDWDYFSSTYNNVEYSPDSQRICHINAQSIYFPNDYLDTNVIPLGRNARFETAIREAYDLYYTLNGLEANAIDNIHVDLISKKMAE